MANKVQKQVTVTRADGTTFQRRQWVNADQHDGGEAQKVPVVATRKAFESDDLESRVDSLIEAVNSEEDLDTLFIQRGIRGKQVKSYTLPDLPKTPGTDLTATLHSGEVVQGTVSGSGRATSIVDADGEVIGGLQASRDESIDSYTIDSVDSYEGLLEAEYRTIRHDMSHLGSAVGDTQDEMVEKLPNTCSFSLTGTLRSKNPNERILGANTFGSNADGTRSYALHVLADGQMYRRKQDGSGLEDVTTNPDQSSWSMNEKQVYGILAENKDLIANGIKNNHELMETNRLSNKLAEEYRQRTGLYI